MTKLKPLDGRVVLKGVKPEETTKSGIILPNKGDEKPEIYEVVALSDGKLMEDGKIRSHQVKVGEKVICSKYAGDDVKIEGEEVKIVSEDSLTAIVHS